MSGGASSEPTGDRLAQIKARLDRVGSTSSNESFDSEDVFTLTLDDVPWLIAEIDSLRVAAGILQKLVAKARPFRFAKGDAWAYDFAAATVYLNETELAYLAAAVAVTDGDEEPQK